MNLKNEIKVLAALEKVLEVTECKDVPAEFTISDRPAVICITPLSEAGRRILSRFYSDEFKDMNESMKKLDYAPDNLKTALRISMDYMDKAVKILKACGSDSIRITAKADYPLTLENEDFRIIIAPRTGED